VETSGVVPNTSGRSSNRETFRFGSRFVHAFSMAMHTSAGASSARVIQCQTCCWRIGLLRRTPRWRNCSLMEVANTVWLFSWIRRAILRDASADRRRRLVGWCPCSGFICDVVSTPPNLYGICLIYKVISNPLTEHKNLCRLQAWVNWFNFRRLPQERPPHGCVNISPLMRWQSS